MTWGRNLWRLWTRAQNGAFSTRRYTRGLHRVTSVARFSKAFPSRFTTELKATIW